MHQCEVGCYLSLSYDIFLLDRRRLDLILLFTYSLFLVFPFLSRYPPSLKKMQGICDDDERYVCMYVYMYVCSISTYIN